MYYHYVVASKSNHLIYKMLKSKLYKAKVEKIKLLVLSDQRSITQKCLV